MRPDDVRGRAFLSEDPVRLAGGLDNPHASLECPDSCVSTIRGTFEIAQAGSEKFISKLVSST
eukprot:SAG31_NODE_1259_length_9077_cov_3.520049_6_plen_63_part_00